MFADRVAAIKAVVADFSLVNVKFLKGISKNHQ
jgi:hypothetical protein